MNAVVPEEASAPRDLRIGGCNNGIDPESRIYIVSPEGSLFFSHLRIEHGNKAIVMTPAQWTNLAAEAETLRMQLAACGVAALSNTQGSAAQHRLAADSPYRCASYDDVVKAVDREMALRADVRRLMQQERETTVDERCTWGECPSCAAPHGERCNPDVGLAIGYAIGGGPPRDGVHVSRIRNAPLRVKLVPA